MLVQRKGPPFCLVRPMETVVAIRADTGSVAKRWLIGGGIWVVLTALVFLLLNPILAAFIAIVTATAVVVLALAANWEDHSTFEQREAARAVKRKEKWDRNKDVRERDRARWEAHQAQQARKAEQ
ncbi:hypothetical protein [Petropleomorpha daqingensis]|uniref:Uncharacterized protein n=1 Tax=Petropleomorpha daqingensis TaxID=2026353 RepID=A0A853CA15_9ACTN|nr:hypothetical protein [Petropleomorpha daqingensis]NYJ04019.1 hypothetical protein [Petropleomorpha daqingensis]